MPPRKRKAATMRGGLKPIAEEDCMPPPQEEEEEEARDAQGRTKEQAIAHIEDEVTGRIQMLLAAGRELAAALRAESQMNCLRIPKKVKEMSVADFFSLSSDEAKHSLLTGLAARLSSLSSKTGGTQKTVPPPPQQAPATTAPTTRTTRRTAARTSLQQDQQQQSSSVLAQPGPLPPSQEQDQGHRVADAADTERGVLRSSSKECTKGEGLVILEASRQAGKQPDPPAGQGGADADLPEAPGAVTPEAPGPDAVAATPANNGPGNGIAHAGLRASASNMVRALPGGASLMAGFTLVKRTVTRGRTRRGAPEENAIMISTADGRQFMVDEGSGLGNVPDKYRREVSAQLEVLQKLTAAALSRKP